MSCCFRSTAPGVDPAVFIGAANEPSGCVVGSDFHLANTDFVATVPGMVITNLGKRGSSLSLSMSQIIGLVVVGSTPTNPMTMRPGGELVLSTAQWDVVTGGIGGLVPGPYWLDVAGKMSYAAPVSGLAVALGYAVSATSFIIEIGPTILL